MTNGTNTADDPHRPLFSLVVACFDVARYLPDFIASIERQRFAGGVEVIAVDDGSTDDSLALLNAWKARRPDLVQVMAQPNGGQASARNLGLTRARGRWVGFPDPDDVLGPRYLSRVARALARCHDRPDMVIVPFRLWNDATGQLTDTHPRRAQFQATRLVDLGREPEYFPGTASAAFFPLDALRAQQCRFDESLRPHFEDGDFCARHLLAQAHPRLLYVTGTHYRYRKRADQSSALQRQGTDERRFTLVPRASYLALLRQAAANGPPPMWLQYLILYELWGYLHEDQRPSGSPPASHGDAARVFVQTLGEISALIDEAAIRRFPVRPFTPERADVLAFGVRGLPHVGTIYRDHTDPATGDIRLRLRYSGDDPSVTLLDAAGAPVVPRAFKRRAIIYFEQPLLHEFVWWVTPVAGLHAQIDGEPHTIAAREPGPDAATQQSPVDHIKDVAGNKLRKHTGVADLVSLGRELAVGLAAQPCSKLPWLRRRYAGAYTFMDWLTDANDNGEVLFRHVRRHHPDVNAWFTLRRGAPGWDALHRDHGDRLLPYGGLRWAILRTLGGTLLTSQISKELVAPRALRHIGAGAARLVFLQHGVIRDDISRWLNTKDIDVMVTSTTAEAASLTDDDTPYLLTSKEVVVTGLPRFDRLWQLAQQYPPERRDLVLVAPTWRSELAVPGGAAERRAPGPGFTGSSFVRAWSALLTDEALRRSIAERGLHIGLLAHPNLRGTVDGLTVPAGVEVLDLFGDDAALAFVRSSVLVTDYSSMAFSAAYLSRPVVYYQFDRDDYFSGANVSRAGYFDFGRDGFGPVATTLEGTTQAIMEMLSDPPARYAKRAHDTFVWHDAGNCERVWQAVGNPRSG